MFCNRAVCGIVINDDKILVVSRRNSEKWGFVGGKVEHGETEEMALKREMFEEVNLKISKFLPLYTGICGSDNGEKSYMTTTYLIYDYETSLNNIKEVEDGLIPMWKTFDDFIQCDNNIFKDYNLKVLENYKELLNSYIKLNIINQ